MSTIVGWRRSWCRFGYVLMLTCLLLAGQAGSALATLTLNGESVSWHSTTDNGFLQPCGSTFNYSVGFGTATGPLPGQFRETGTVTLGGGQVTAWIGSYEIDSGATVRAKGTVQLAPGGGHAGSCVHSIDPNASGCLQQIDTATASAELKYANDTGFVEIGNSSINLYLQVRCGNTASLTSTFTETFSTFGPPTATITLPADGAVYQLGQALSAAYSCADSPGAPGISSCVGTVANGGAIDTSIPGLQTLSVTATSLDGQSAVVTSHFTVVGPPTVAITTPHNGGIYNLGQVVNASYTCTEFPGGPGIASCSGTLASGARIDTSVVGPFSFSVVATSLDGQTATATSKYLVVGPPLITIASPTDGAHYNIGQVVVANYSCADAPGGPGIATCLGSLATGSRIDTSSTGPHAFSVTAVSVDGQVSTKANSYSVIGGPSVTILSPFNGATFNFGQAVTATYSCSEAPGGPGITSCSGPVPNGQNIDTSTAGPHTFTVTATSLDGQTATASVNYTVLAAKPTVLTNPVSAVQFEGRPVSFTATATGTPAPTVQWQVSNDGGLTFTSMLGATSTTLTFNAIGSQNQSQYRALFSNAAGTALSASATLGVISARSSVIVTPPSVTADGKATATITVTLLDGNGNPMTSPVVLNPSSFTGLSLTRVGWLSGTTTFTATDLVPQVVTFTAVDDADGITIGSVTVEFLGPSALSTVTANPVEVPADGTQSTVTVTLIDRNGNPVDGKLVSVSFSHTGPGSPAITLLTGSSDSAGRVFFKVSDQLPESATFTAYDVSDGQLNIGSATVTFLGPSALSTVTVTPPAVIADGTASSTIVVTLLDRNGHPISGKYVWIAGDGSSVRWSVTPPFSNVIKTDANGKATYTVTDTTVQVVSFTAMDLTDAAAMSSSVVGRGTVAFVPVGLGSVAAGQGVGASAISTSAGGSISVTAGGGSAGDMVVVGQYGSNPGGVLISAAGTAFDILVKQPTGYTSLTVTDCNLGGGTSVSWWTGFAWQAVSPAPTYAAGPPACATFVLNSASRPCLCQLTGTVFAGVDTLPPSVTLMSTPPSVTHSTSASFTFNAIDVDDPQTPLTVLCALDGGQPAPCTSPFTIAGPLSPGVHTFSVSAADPQGNVGRAAFTWQVHEATAMVYTGDQAVVVGSTLTPAALLTSPAAVCAAGQRVDFALDRNPITGAAGAWPAGSAITSPGGLATAPPLLTTGWARGTYNITSSLSETTACDGSIDSAILTLGSPGKHAEGSGVCSLGGDTLTFRFSIERDGEGLGRGAREPGEEDANGRAAIVEPGKWAITGSIAAYVVADSEHGAASGSGTLFVWDATADGGRGGWRKVADQVRFTITFTASPDDESGGAARFGVHIDYQPTAVQPPLPNAAMLVVREGEISLR